MGLVRARAGVGALLVALALVASGCGDEEAAEQQPPSVSGTVLDGPGGEPEASVEIELLVHPSALGSSGGEVVSVDRGTSAADGSFALSATLAQLRPAAGADGRVQVEVRRVGEDVGTRTTVLLEREQSTGEAQVVGTTGVVVETPAN